MKIHRFYTPDTDLVSDFWLKDAHVIHQWTKVLRFRPGQQVVLFDGEERNRLYSIVEIANNEAHLELITEEKKLLPQKNIYLFWSLLKKDKNDWVLQKCTELGVSHFIPILADRSEKTGFNIERAHKIVVEASEQCGRSDIPTIRDPIHINNALDQYKNNISIYICEQDGQASVEKEGPVGILIGPEGGWSDAEKKLFKDDNLKQLNLHGFTLRAETAAITAVTIVR